MQCRSTISICLVENNYRKRILENIWCSFGDLCCFIWISIPIHFYGYGSLGPSKNWENYRFELFKLINSEEKLLLNDSPPPYIFYHIKFLKLDPIQVPDPCFYWTRSGSAILMLMARLCAGYLDQVDGRWGEITAVDEEKRVRVHFYTREIATVIKSTTKMGR